MNSDAPFAFESLRVSIRVEELQPGPAPGERKWVNTHQGCVLDVLGHLDGKSLARYLDAIGRVSLKPDGTYELVPSLLPSYVAGERATCMLCESAECEGRFFGGPCPRVLLCNDAPCGTLGTWCDLKPDHDGNHHHDASGSSWDRQGSFV